MEQRSTRIEIYVFFSLVYGIKPISMVRKSFNNRGPGYSDKAVVIRCAREDQTSITLKLYYLENGSARLGFWIKGREFLLPVGIILKAFIDTNDYEIFVSLTCYYNERYQREKGAVGTQLIDERALIILDEVRDLSLFTRHQCLKHIGEYFRPVMDGFETESYTTVAEAVLEDYIFIHLRNNHDKFNLLIFMLQKLYALVDQTAAPDNPDTLQNQEVLLPGHLIAIYLKEKLQVWLRRARQLLDELAKKKRTFDIKSVRQVKKIVAKNSINIGRAIESMIKVGRLNTQSGLDLPQIVHPHGPVYSTHNTLTSTTKPTYSKHSEDAIIDYVSVDGTGSKNYLQKVNIHTRHPRYPIIGDKFSSRHGQKGVCSQLWPSEDMPFSEVTGMQPDLIINSHAFPSRMTIAMLLESIAAKGGCLHGKFVDATPFSRSNSNKEDEDNSPLIDELGQMLIAYGFNYYGEEAMYSGIYGRVLRFKIFMGPVYYQRLRHMVSDKFQVRSTGTVDQITRQPIGGRKRGGGIRFGEMERDAVLAHGAAYLLHDRLHTCSDYHIAHVCSYCGSLLAATTVQPQKKGLPPARTPKSFICQACKTGEGMETVAMPHVSIYLAAELKAMNIKLKVQLSRQAS
ncbi:DNA-directed RNA polymerase I subunit 2-like [Curcuma longa]|uniref:DNA-directed RNA polymerase I subunit 2-like n=1 Tax=Curcuma longa TaxID=136217 RepID=UPI003D9E9ED1